MVLDEKEVDQAIEPNLCHRNYMVLDMREFTLLKSRQKFGWCIEILNRVRYAAEINRIYSKMGINKAITSVEIMYSAIDSILCDADYFTEKGLIEYFTTTIEISRFMDNWINLARLNDSRNYEPEFFLFYPDWDLESQDVPSGLMIEYDNLYNRCVLEEIDVVEFVKQAQDLVQRRFEAEKNPEAEPSPV